MRAICPLTRRPPEKTAINLMIPAVLTVCVEGLCRRAVSTRPTRPSVVKVSWLYARFQVQAIALLGQQSALRLFASSQV